MKKAVAVLIIVLGIFWLKGSYGADNLTNSSFEDVDDNGNFVDWEKVGSKVEVSDDAHSGKRSLRLLRDETVGEKTETGFNRFWKPDSGEQGGMLAQLQGGLSFWYKVISAKDAKLNIYAIPMSARPWEDTGEQRSIYTVPAEHIGDGQWHQGWLAYKFSKAKWVHVSGRIVGKTGEILIDDIKWMPKIGGVAYMKEINLEEIEGKEGESCRVKVKIQNSGDGPLTDLNVTLNLPDNLSTKEKIVAIKKIETEDMGEITFIVEGRREGKGTISASVTDDKGLKSSQLTFEPAFRIFEFRPQKFIMEKGVPCKIEVIVENRKPLDSVPYPNPRRGGLVIDEGTSILKDVNATITLDDNLVLEGSPATQTLTEIRPGKQGIISWTVKPLKETTSAKISVDVKSIAGSGKVDNTIIVGSPVSEPSPSNSLNAYVKDNNAIIENDRVRLVFPKNSFGYGIGIFQAKTGKGWKTAAKLPYLGKITCKTAGGNEVYPFYGEPTAEVKKDIAVLSFKSSAKDSSGNIWDFTSEFTLKKSDTLFNLTDSLKSSSDAKLLAFEGPMVYAGEGSYGEDRYEAVYPGMEWLVEKEISSSTLDYDTKYKNRIRYVPHPYKVTIPFMTVCLPDNITVALLWDMYQKWDGTNWMVNSVFCSPDWIEGRNSHLMGLFVPTTPKWVKENERLAYAGPYELKANTLLTIVSKILIQPDSKDSLVAQDKWFELYGVPDPAPIPRGSWEKEVEFSMNAYMKTMWIPEEKMWWSSMSGPKTNEDLLRHKVRSPDYIFQLLDAANITQDKNLQEQYTSRANEVLKELGGTRPYGAEELGFTFAGPLNQISGLAGSAGGALSSRKEDGSWRFKWYFARGGIFKGKDFSTIGPDNAVEVGIMAQNTYRILRAAHILGDADLYESARKSLDFMKRFTVPRAAQIWECPVHTPDILASADAVDAYVEAYKFNGEKQHLDEAIRWARTGLPFIYMWGVPEYDFMLGASIAIFGGSFFNYGWIGQPVQWNGLRYAAAILKLGEFDKSFPWEKVAKSITISAMYQQGKEKDWDFALWPDNIDMVKYWRCPWVFNPTQILLPAMKFMGRPWTPNVVVLKDKDSRIHISSRVEITGAMRKDNVISFGLNFPKNLTGYALVSNVTKPGAVYLKGRKIEEYPNLEGSDVDGWKYDTGKSALAIKVTKDGKSDIRIEGVNYNYVSVIPKSVSKIDFEFKTGLEGWAPSNQIENLRTEDGIMKGRATGGDPYMHRSSVKVDGNVGKVIKIKVKASTGAGIAIYWITEDSTNWAEDKSIHLKLQPDGQFHDYIFEVGNHKMWAGKIITSIRLDPIEGGTGGDFEIDYIKTE